MVAPLIAGIAGVATRYGVKKGVKKLIKKATKSQVKKAKDNQVRYKSKDGNANTDKISVKKLYRGSREPDGSYSDPGNKILREQFGVNIGRRPIGKPPKGRTNQKNYMNSLKKK